MKLLSILLLLFSGTLLPFNSMAQNWSPFPFQQTGYFANPDTALSFNAIYEYKNDSIELRSTDSILFFNRFPVESNHSKCFYPIKTMLGDTLDIDSLVLSGGKYYYFLNGDTAMLNPAAQPGNSWTINCPSGGSNFDQVLISCDSIRASSLFGVNDSVKYFSFHALKASKPINYFNNYSFLLSKNLGLLNFMSFRYLLVHPDDYLSHTYALRGLKNSTNSLGFKLPTFKDYFSHYHIGNVYEWEDVSQGIMGGQVYPVYLRDSILNVNISPDSVKIYYSEKTYTANPGGQFYYKYPLDSSIFYKSDYSDIIDKTSLHLGFSLFENQGLAAIYYNYISIDSCFDTVFSAGTNSEINFTGCTYDPPFENDGWFNLGSGIGLIAHGYGDGDGSESWTMIGYKLYDGSSCGNYQQLPDGLNIVNSPESSNISFYPNPFYEQTKLIINTSFMFQDYNLTLLDVTGRIVKCITQISSKETIINRDGLSSGIYFYQLSKGGEDFANGKLIIQ